jgi:hypothetical protein
LLHDRSIDSPGLAVALGGDDVDTDQRIRMVELQRWLEKAASLPAKLPVSTFLAQHPHSLAKERLNSTQPSCLTSTKGAVVARPRRDRA